MITQSEWAVVTGASSGIGRAFALQLASRGYPVVLVARREEELRRVAHEIAVGGGRAEVVVADLASDLGLRDVERAVRELGDVGVLVNAAGFGIHGPFLETPTGTQTSQIDVNIGALVSLTREFLPEMVARRRGWIINVASILSFMPTPWFATYGATKAFVLHFTEALAHEVRGTGVRVLATSPGVVSTEFSSVAGWAQDVALPLLTPEVVADVSLRAIARGRVVRVIGAVWRLLALLTAITPRPIMRWIMGRILGRSLRSGLTTQARAVAAPSR